MDAHFRRASVATFDYSNPHRREVLVKEDREKGGILQMKKHEEGQGLVPYALILMLVAIAFLGAEL